MGLTGEALQEKVRELADMVGNAVVDEALPLEALEAVACCLKEDYEQIRQAVKDIQEEQQAIERMTAGKEG